VRFNNSKLTRDEVLSRYFPDYQPAAELTVTGLSGSSCIIENGAQRLVLRQHHDPHDAESHFLRQYHALNQLPVDLAPPPRFYTPGWMAVDYIDGEMKTELPEERKLAALLYYLHQQPRFGWRIALTPLLQRYWQHSSPSRRTPFWLSRLQRLSRHGEPVPLRLAPLHMDIHAGNLVHTQNGLRLIDWEYAGDGDVALELAAVWLEDEAQRQSLVNEYARQAKMDVDGLWQQVRRWRPWVLMLMAGWFECRWQQTGEQQFITLANETWCQLKKNG
jgi:thiamine kinase